MLKGKFLASFVSNGNAKSCKSLAGRRVHERSKMATETWEKKERKI